MQLVWVFLAVRERMMMGSALRKGVHLVSELSSEIASHSSVTKVPGKGVSMNP